MNPGNPLPKDNTASATLIIEPAVNGFLVRKQTDLHMIANPPHVFQSFTELINHLDSHFPHRNQDILID